MIQLVLFCGCLVFVDCNSSQTTAASSQPQTPQRKDSVQDAERSQVLLKISFDGGLVPDRTSVTGGRPGHSEFIVTRGGNYSLDGDVRQTTKGALSKVELDELRQQINTADFIALRSRRFTGECPTASDGTEATYTFYTKAGFEVIASCTVAIDQKAALFLTVEEIYKKYGR